MQTGLHHHCHQTDGLERNSLPAGVWTGDNDDKFIIFQDNIDGDSFLLRQQRMAGAVKLDDRIAVFVVFLS